MICPDEINWDYIFNADLIKHSRKMNNTYECTDEINLKKRNYFRGTNYISLLGCCTNVNGIAIDEKAVPWASSVLKFPSSTLTVTRITNFIRSKICFIQCHVTHRFPTYSHTATIIWLASSISNIHKINPRKIFLFPV